MMTVLKDSHGREPTPETVERQGWDRFGFLPSPVSVHYPGGAIEPVSNYAEVMQWVQEHIHHRNLVAGAAGEKFEPGILFPPIAWRQEHAPVTDDLIRVVPGSEGWSSLHEVPTSHYVQIDGATDLMPAREGEAGLVIKLVGFLCDSPTQFHDWWLDGPCSIGEKRPHLESGAPEDFLGFCVPVWRAWSPDMRAQLISTLWMHGRAAGHQSYWERFAWEYTVTDTCYRIIENVWPGRLLARWQAQRSKGAPGRPPHSARIELMCTELGVRFGADEKDWVGFAVGLRNGLLHEGMWSGSQPSRGGSQEAARAGSILHKLNQRLIVGLLGYKNAFVGSNWLQTGTATFDRQSSRSQS